MRYPSLYVRVLCSFSLFALIFTLSACQKGCEARFATPANKAVAPKAGEVPDMHMLDNMLKNHWGPLKGLIKEHWDKLDDNDLAHIDGSYEKLSATIQQKYNKSKEEADNMIKDFLMKHKPNL